MRVAAPRPWGRSCADCRSRAGGEAAGRALGSRRCRRSAPPTWRSPTRRSGAGRRWSCSTARSTTGRATFAAQIPALAESFRLYLPDARGHGRTRWDAADGFEAEWLVDDLEAFVDALGLRTFHLIGYSMGAMTALGFAVRAPERLRTLVVVGITAAREPRAAVGRRLMDPERILRDDPAWAAEMALTIDAVQGPGAWQRLLPAIAADIDTPAAADARRAALASALRPSSRSATAIRSCRSARLGAQPPGPRRAAVRRARQRP